MSRGGGGGGRSPNNHRLWVAGIATPASAVVATAAPGTTYMLAATSATNFRADKDGGDASEQGRGDTRGAFTCSVRANYICNEFFVSRRQIKM